MNISISSFISSIDWNDVKNKTAAAIRCTIIMTELAIAFALIIAEYVYNNRDNIKNAIVKTIAMTYIAGVYTRMQYNKLCNLIEFIYNQVLLISDKSSTIIKDQPIVILAPITSVIVTVYQYISLIIRNVYKYNMEAI